jgi:zinc protease
MLSIRSLYTRVAPFIVFLFVFSLTAFAQTDLSSKLPFDPNSIHGTFANGLTYYVRTNHKPEKKVELRLVVKAGSILEDNSQLGLAHFMEHMNFNGTKYFPKNELVSYLQSIGVKFGADLNAYTSFDQTVYMLPIPTDKPGNLEKGFQVIEDWAHNALLTDKDIDDERGVVLEESRLGKGAGERMLYKYFPKYAQGSLYAERLPIGKDNILKSFKYETLRRFYRDWYRPDLIAVMVVGDIDTATAMKLLREHFEGLQNPKKEKERFYADVKPRAAPDAMVVTDKEATNSGLQIMFPFTKIKDEITLGDYREHLCRDLVTAMINQRLDDLAQSANPPFPYAQVFFSSLVHGYESFSAYAGFGNNGPDTAMMALGAELLRAKDYGFTSDELERAKKEQQSFMDNAYKERNTTESKDYINEFIRGFLSKEAIPGIENEYNYYKELLPGIQLNELNAMVNDWMKNENTFTLITAPDKPEIKLPTDAQLLSLTKTAFAQKVNAPEEKKLASELISVKPTPGKVVSQKEEQGLGATTYTLSNGIRVTIKNTDYKSDEILFEGIKKGGSNSYGAADKSNVNFATDVVESMGIGDFSPSDLQKVLAGKNIRVNTRINDITDNISGNSTVKDLESMLQLVNLYITKPRKDEALFNAYKQKQIMQLQFLSSNPQIAFIDTTVKTLYNNNPLARMVFPKPADYDKLNLDRALEIYKKEIGTIDGFHFFLVGNIDAKTALPLIETYLGSIQSDNTTPNYKDNGVRPMAGDNTLNLKKGKENKSLIIAMYYGETGYSEDLALKAQALAEILNIKVIEDLREKMGSIYTGGFNASVAKEPYERYSITLQLPCGPENVDKLLAAAKEEIDSIKSFGPTEKDLEKVKAQWHEKHRINLKENKYWEDKLTSILFWDRSKDNVLDYDKWIDKLTTSEIKSTANMLFNGKNKFVSILYPETQTSGKETDRSSN